MCNGTVYIASEDTKHKRVLIQVPPEITAEGGEGGENGSEDGEGGARGGGWRRSISSDLENISIKFVFSIINCQESFIKEKKNFQNKTIEVCKIDERKREIRGERGEVNNREMTEMRKTSQILSSMYFQDTYLIPSTCTSTAAFSCIFHQFHLPHSFTHFSLFLSPFSSS